MGEHQEYEYIKDESNVNKTGNKLESCYAHECTSHSSDFAVA